MELQKLLIDNFNGFANYVNYERAITNAFDGLKPSQRRILYTMYKMNLKPGDKTKKCASIAGRTLELHPHGDASVYGALVRMAQPFSLLSPLIEGMGNFGSLDMGPASSRYTEAKLSYFGWECIKGLKDNIVPMVDNYDGTTQEPSVLPVPMPLLLINGSTGIGVGMRASIPSHNINEVIDATSLVIKNEDTPIEELVKVLKGPDFNSGCDIVNKAEMLEAYRTGYGKFKMRAKFVIEGKMLKATNLPYQVSGAKVIEQINHAISNGELAFLREVIDISAKEETVLFDIGRKNIDEAIQALCACSDLEKTFSFDLSVVLETPQRLGLQDYLKAWVRQHKFFEIKKLNFQLTAHEDRLEIIDGFISATASIDEIIAIIRGSESRKEAKENLVRRGFSEKQADAILDLRLARLTKLSEVELQNEKAELLDKISNLDALLTSNTKLNDFLVSQLEGYRKFAKPRKSALSQNIFTKAKQIVSSDFNVVIKANKAYVSEGVGGKNTVNGDALHPVYLLKDNVVLPIKNAKDPIFNGVQLLDAGTKFIFHLSEDGYIKKTDVKQVFTSRKATVAKQDKVVAIIQSTTGEDILTLTLSNGTQIQIPTEDISATGRNARGVIAVKTGDGLKVKSAQIDTKKDHLPFGRNRKIR